MRIGPVSIANFRSFEGLTVDLEQASRFLIGENAIGKSSFVTAIARALGKDTRGFQRDDFRSLEQAIEIRVTLGNLDAAQRGVFAEAADFGPTTSLTVGVLVTWDPDTEELEIIHGYPTKNWKQSSKAEREAMDVYWIPDGRDPSRLLQMGWRRNVLGDLLAQVDLVDPIATAMGDIKGACSALATTANLQALLTSACEQLSAFVPDVTTGAYALADTATSELSLLRHLQLTLNHGGVALPMSAQSSGLAQLTLFAFSMLGIRARPASILLVDEPESSLHPQCQRALIAALDAMPNQYVVATHSASLLDRADPRKIMRLHREAGSIRAARASTLTNPEADALSRFTTARNAEAFFARAAILVEGDSDRFAIEAVARKKGRNLDADGISVVVMQGAGGIRPFLTLLGPSGLGVRLAGLCDANEVPQWSNALQTQGLIAAPGTTALEAAGFFVNDPDLEAVLIGAVGLQRVENLIASQADADAFERYRQQPAHAAKTRREQVHGFLHSGGRQVVYAPLLVALLELPALPHSLGSVVDAA